MSRSAEMAYDREVFELVYAPLHEPEQTMADDVQWEKRQTFGKMVKIGDGKGQVAQFEGLLVDIVRSPKYDNLMFNCLDEAGELCSVVSSAMIDSALDYAQIGMLVKIQFIGWGNNKAGTKTKQIEVFTYDGPGNSEIKRRFPKYGTIKPKRGSARDLLSGTQKDAPGAGEGDDDLPFS